MQAVLERLRALPRIKLSRSSLMILLLGAVLVFLVLYPLALIPLGSVRSGTAVDPGPFTLEGYAEGIDHPRFLSAAWNTLWMSVVRAVISLGLAIFFAWVVARTDTPLAGWLEGMTTFRFFLPTLPTIIGWELLLWPKSGLINQALQKIPFVDIPPLNIFSYWGIIWVSVTTWTSLLFMMILPAFKRMDASLEEASRMSGANTRTTLFRVTLPLLAPAFIGAGLVGFARMMESFDVELFLGPPARILVFSTFIYNFVMLIPPHWTAAMALTTMLLVVAMVLLMGQWRFLGSGREYATVTGRGFAVRPMRLGRWKYVTLAIMLLWFGVTVILPTGVLVLGSFMKVAGYFAIKNPFTLNNYRYIVQDPVLLSSIRNTLVLSVTVATVGVVLALLISYVVVRTRFVGRKFIDLLAWLPFTVPSLVLGFAMLWVWGGGLPIMLYGTMFPMIFGLIAKNMPLGTRTLQGTMIQISKELEESSRVHGAAWLYTFRRIVLPLVWPGVVSAWLIMLLLSMRDLATVILLYTPGTRVLSTVIYSYSTTGGMMEETTIISLVMVALALGAYLLVKLVSRVQPQVRM